MESAERLGISLRRFEGWEPEETVRYEYEFPNRLARKVVTRESEWNAEQRGWMLALTLYRATRCPNCRRSIDECTSPDADGAYTVPPPTRCHATTALSIAQKAYAEQPQSEALLWRAERR